jgi:hypothetical protein
MYEGGRQERWETPFSEAKSLVMVSLVHEGPLVITLEDARHPERQRYRVTFDSAPLYRNILEEYRTNEGGNPTGSWSVVVHESGWLKLMREREALVDIHSPGLNHYCIITEDDVVDVLSNTPPTVEELGPAPAGAAPAGRSRILYHPEDREEIDRLVEEVARRK